MRVRARWHVEELGRGTWAAVVTEIPYQVQKSRLIEIYDGPHDYEKPVFHTDETIGEVLAKKD